MGVKYILQFKAPDGIAWQCDIETPSYSDTPIVILGQSEAALEIDYDGDNADDPFNPFIKSTAKLSFYNQGQVDMDQLMGADDKDFLLKAFRNGHLEWTGFLKPEDVSRKVITPPYQCELTFTCGLTLLDDLPYTHQDLPGTTSVNNRCPMNYIRQILFVNLGIKLPVRWTNNLQCSAFSDDFYTGSVRWSPYNEGFYTYQQGITGSGQGPLQTCGYILRGFMLATQSRIYQSKGKWIIRRVNDTINNSIFYREIAATLGIMTVISGTETLFKRIGRSGYRFISENAELTSVQGLKSFKTTYGANIRSNIIPNGNFDSLTSDLTITDLLTGSLLLYWGSYNTLLVNSNASLDGRSGYSAQLVSAAGTDAFFTMTTPGGVLGEDGLPLDAYVLVKVINFSFMVSPGTGFASVDGDGLIIWDSQPLQFKMVLRQGGSTYYLNEFGIWSGVDAFIPITIEGLKLGEIAQVSFDKFQGIKLPQPATPPQAGDICDLQIIFKVKPGQTYTLDNVSITIDNGTDVYEVFNDNSKNTTSDEIELGISSSFGGYMLSNFMSSPFRSDDECRFNDALVYSGTLTGVNSHARMRFRYKASQVLNTDMYVSGGHWTFDEIYSVDSLLGKKFLPLNAKYYVEKGIVNMIAMEARNDNITLRDSFYNSNDNLNSN